MDDLHLAAVAKLSAGLAIHNHILHPEHTIYPVRSVKFFMKGECSKFKRTLKNRNSFAFDLGMPIFRIALSKIKEAKIGKIL